MKKKLIFLVITAFLGLSTEADEWEDLSSTPCTSTNTVPLTTNLLFFLASGKDSGTDNQFDSTDPILYGVCFKPPRTTGTNPTYIKFLMFPHFQPFDFKLFDQMGGEVSKTKAGRAATQQPHLPTNMKELDRMKQVPLRQYMAKASSLFRPEDMFVITNKGVYDLVVRMRICVAMTNGVPDYKAMTSKGFPREPLGVAVSSPYRAKVIKR